MSGRKRNHYGSATTSMAKRGICKSKGKMETRFLLQDGLLGADFILKKVFRKDGPPLGAEFDSLPSDAFLHCKRGRSRCKKSHRACQEKQKALRGNKASKSCHHACNENQRTAKRRKVCKPTVLDNHGYNEKSAPMKKHGIGKGLMTVWRAVNPDAVDIPTGANFNQRNFAAVTDVRTSAFQKPLQVKKSRKRQPVVRTLGKGTKVKDKRKPPISRRKVEGNYTEKPKQPRREKCELALQGEKCPEDVEQFALLVDDEELELQELQAGPNPLTCSVHFTTNGLHGCSLCKGFLDKFPPNSIMMRPPLYEQPWGSSQELVKKLFKALHFLCTYAVMLNICSFTLDEFAQAFHDKDSMLLGKVHVSLLKLLLSDIETELAGGFVPRASQNGKFLELLHSVENQQYDVEFWKKSLNALSWTEVLRQVFVAAGFGSKSNTLQREDLNKEVNCMVKCGLNPGTLKGELFSILSVQGNNGMKVSDLAKFPKISDLNLAATNDDLELLICSTLLSDITLFEKISCSAYRLRINSVAAEAEMLESDAEDCGSIDDDSKDCDTCISDDESEDDSGTSAVNKLKKTGRHKNGKNMLAVYTEIDESHPGEAWLLGLMEGEYSDLSIEEKLNAFVALVDLLSAGSSTRMEDPLLPLVEHVPKINHYGSGGKIKRLSGRQHNLPSRLCGSGGQMLAIKKLCRTSGPQPVDSSACKLCAEAITGNQSKNTKKMEIEGNIHPMQSIFLGSDRRYNRYWLFLGPCSAYDPGHKRIYFESSEDGHWEIIDTEEALCTLLSVLDFRGMREAHLLASLKKRESYLCRAMSNMLNDSGVRQLTFSDQSELNISREDSSSAVSEVDNLVCLSEVVKDFPPASSAIVQETGRKEQLKQKWSRLQDFDAWIWISFYSDLSAVKYSKKSYHDSLTRCEYCHDLFWRDEKHCKTCHTTFELDFDLEERYAIHVATCRNNGKTDMFPEHKVLPSQLQALKAAVHAIESVMPEGALVGAWTKYAHKLWVKRLRRTSTLVELLQVLADFVAAISEEWLCQSSYNSVLEELIASFTTIPQTLSAVALWVVKLDATICPYIERLHGQK